MTGLKYPFPAYGFFQKRNEKTWRNINDPQFFPTCEGLCNREILPRQELFLGSFIPLFAQDWLWGRGFREGWSWCRDHVRAAASITWRDKRKDLEGQYLKADLLKCRSPSPRTSTWWVLVSHWRANGKSLLHTRRESVACESEVQDSGQKKIQFIFKCHLQSVSVTPTTHDIKGKKGKV